MSPFPTAQLRKGMSKSWSKTLTAWSSVQLHRLGSPAVHTCPNSFIPKISQESGFPLWPPITNILKTSKNNLINKTKVNTNINCKRKLVDWSQLTSPFLLLNIQKRWRRNNIYSCHMPVSASSYFPMWPPPSPESSPGEAHPHHP